MPIRPEIPVPDTANEIVTQEIFDTIPLISIVTGIQHIAEGSTDATFRLQWLRNRATVIPADQGPPIAAWVLRAVEKGAESSNPGNIRPALNFDYDGRTGDVILFEPEGLTADSEYTLTVMLIG